jgi:hypothetical protein
MSEERKRLPPPTPHHLPAASPATTPSVALPSLPTSSGKVWGSRTSLMEADTRFVRAHSQYLEARTEQTNQMKLLVDARIGLALKISELAILPELAQHEYERGRCDRAHDVAMQRLTHETAEVNARINLLRAQQHLASLEPQPEPAPQPAFTPGGLTPDEVEEIIASLPEASDELRRTISLLLKGRLKEKQG